MVINCNGLKGEKGGLTFQTAVVQHSPDLIIGCESKLDTIRTIRMIRTGSIFPEGYGITRKDGTKSGGGVFTAIRDNLISLDKPHIGSFIDLKNIPVLVMSPSINCLIVSPKLG